MKRILNWLAILLMALPLAAMSANPQAEKLTEDVNNRVLKILEQQRGMLESNPQALYALVQKEVLPFIDFEAMTKLTIGAKWREATPQQQQRLVNAYRGMLVRAYSRSLLSYAGSTLKVKYSRPGPKPEYLSVVCELMQPNNLPRIPMVYDLRLVNGQWKTYNLDIEGVSLIKNYRTSFAAEINAHGIESLITRLEKGDDFDA